MGWSDIEWLIKCLFVFILFVGMSSRSSKSKVVKKIKGPIPQIKNNESCVRCGQPFVRSALRHKYTGYCFNCISSQEELLMEALAIERKYRDQIETDRRLYDIYLSSDKWRKIRGKAIISSNNECVNCGSKVNLQVHHKTYDSLGNEDLGDLAVLCKSCHTLAHTPGSKVKMGDFDVDAYLARLDEEEYQAIITDVHAANGGKTVGKEKQENNEKNILA